MGGPTGWPGKAKRRSWEALQVGLEGSGDPAIGGLEV